MTSVAFPVIGPGIKFKYPPKEAIELLAESIRDLGLSASTGSLNTIHVVIKPGYPDSEEVTIDTGKTGLEEACVHGLLTQKHLICVLFTVLP